jgi:antitoxin CptB
MSLDDVRRKKLKYRAWHRGFVEADLILGPFADNHLAAMDTAALDAFEVLLDQPDQDLYAWIIGQCETPAQFQGPVMDQIRAFRFTAHAAQSGGA